jgi:hypothetical protein
MLISSSLRNHAAKKPLLVGGRSPAKKLAGVSHDTAQIPAREHRPHDAVSASPVRKPTGHGAVAETYDISLCDTDSDVDTQSVPTFHRLKKARKNTPFCTPPRRQKKGLSFSEALAVRAFRRTFPGHLC